ncbi:MAG: hypothetical protein RIR33_3159 [Pseudomonadota bacterium]|jgi:putative Mn2+ efflux pump MntP
MNPSLLLLAIGLAADAFAVSVTQGAAVREKPLNAALMLACIFGLAQAIAPLLGWSLGQAFAGHIEHWDHWLAFGLLALIGAKMIRDALTPPEEEEEELSKGLALFMLAIATSIDAAAAGIALPTIGAPIAISVATIGLVTFALCFTGVWIGQAGSRAIGPNAAILGGVVLILIGAKVLVDHRAFG